MKTCFAMPVIDAETSSMFHHADVELVVSALETNDSSSGAGVLRDVCQRFAQTVRDRANGSG